MCVGVSVCVHARVCVCAWVWVYMYVGINLSIYRNPTCMGQHLLTILSTPVRHLVCFPHHEQVKKESRETLESKGLKETRGHLEMMEIKDQKVPKGIQE